MDDSRVKEIWGAYILSLSELPPSDFNTQNDQDLLLAYENPGEFPTQDNPFLMRVCEETEFEDSELRAIAEAAEAVELLDTEF